MTYTARRDHRFEYVWDVVHFIEKNQCEACVFRKSPHDFDPDFASEYPMCLEVEAPLMMEEPVEALDDKGDLGVVCSRFKLGDPSEPVDPDQLTLGE